MFLNTLQAFSIGSMGLMLPVILIVVVVMMMMKSKKKPGEDATVRTQPEHIKLIKKWLREQKDISNKSIHMDMLERKSNNKETPKEERKKELYVLMFKTVDSKSGQEDGEYAIEVEAVQKRISKKNWSTTHVVNKEMSIPEAKDEFKKELERQAERETKRLERISKQEEKAKTKKSKKRKNK